MKIRAGLIKSKVMSPLQNIDDILLYLQTTKPRRSISCLISSKPLFNNHSLKWKQEPEWKLIKLLCFTPPPLGQRFAAGFWPTSSSACRSSCTLAT